MVKNRPARQETRVRSLGQDNSLEKGMATHPSILAWRIPWTEEPGGLQPMGSQRVGHDWATNTFTFPYTGSTAWATGPPRKSPVSFLRATVMSQSSLDPWHLAKQLVSREVGLSNHLLCWTNRGLIGNHTSTYNPKSQLARTVREMQIKCSGTPVVGCVRVKKAGKALGRRRLWNRPSRMDSEIYLSGFCFLLFCVTFFYLPTSWHWLRFPSTPFSSWLPSWIIAFILLRNPSSSLTSQRVEGVVQALSPLLYRNFITKMGELIAGKIISF